MSKTVRILHILQRMEAAGVQTFLMNIYRNIDRDKIQFDFLVHYETPQFFDEEIEKLGGKIYRLSFREDFNVIKYIRDLNNFFKEHPEYKIVHGHMNSLGAVYLRYAKKWNVPVRIAHSHTNSMQKDLKRYLKLIMNKFYAKNATELFACSDAAGKFMFKNKKFTVINNAINCEDFKFNPEKRISKRKELGLNNEFIIGSVGRFEPVKNQKFAIEVFKEYLKINKNSILLFVGTGSMENEIKRIVENEQLEEKVVFLGNRKDVAALYQVMDVFLFPSLFEGLGIVGVEAQAAGVPTICTDTLPKEINLTPLIKRVSLNKTPKEWAEEIKKISKNKYKQKDMRKYIKNANYDIKTLTSFLEKFYLENWR